MDESRELTVLERRIRIAVYRTEAGVNILIEGGDKGHIGAVAVAGEGKVIESISFPGHMEEIICKNWAEKISAVYPDPVVVEAGIHYDNITKAQIQEVLEILDAELAGLSERLGGGRGQKTDTKKS